MNIKTSFIHMESSDAAKFYAEKRSEHFKKYFHGKISVHWSFKVEKQSQIAHCHVMGDSLDYFAEASLETLNASIDEVAAKIERQLKKKKEIVTNHKQT